MTRGRDKFRKYRLFLKILEKIFSFFPKNIRRKLLILFWNTKGYRGLALRYVLLKTIANSVGENVAIYENVYLFKPENLTIGNNVSIHPMSYIDAIGDIIIGNDVSIAHAVTLMSSNHKYEKKDIPIKDQGLDLRKIEIEDNVWIGAKATKKYEEDVILVGVPAKVKRRR